LLQKKIEFLSRSLLKWQICLMLKKFKLLNFASSYVVHI
jgi:hypothetical protein